MRSVPRFVAGRCPAAGARHVLRRWRGADPVVPVFADDLAGRHPARKPSIAARATPHGGRRLTMVTDSINPPHLYAGVATALVLAALLAERTDRTLRILTAVAPGDPENFARIMRVSGIGNDIHVAFDFCGDGHAADRYDDEVFITTSWWSTQSILLSAPVDRVLYLVQEDERLFYPAGDEQLQCSEVMSRPDVACLVNSELLRAHLSASIPHFAARSTSFEPSFPGDVFYPVGLGTRSRLNLIYYARPQNARNLFLRGLEALDTAFTSNSLHAADWNVTFVGKDIPPMQVGRGTVRLKIRPDLDWEAYAALCRTCDLGLSLMHTPHPSYPPLDLAASGAIVVTNTFLGKASLDAYSENILCSAPTVDALVEALAEGAARSRDIAQRRARWERSGLLRDWRDSFADALDAYSITFG